MDKETLSPLTDWGNFYVIVGSSAGALTGLQFVVLTLIAQARAASDMTQIRAFGSPTVVHFCMALLVAAIMSAPWRGLSAAASCLVICGVAGVIYSVSVIRHAREQQGYEPDTEDWLWYIITPVVAYVLLVVAAVFLVPRTGISLALIAATTLFLLFLGIRNSWDTVTYITVTRLARNEKTEHR